MTKRRPDARAVFVVPDGSGVWLKSRLRRYSASLRGAWRNGAALRALGDLTEVFAVRAGIDLSQPPPSTLGPFACLARHLAASRRGVLLAAFDRQQQMRLPRIGAFPPRRTRPRRRRRGRLGEAALERVHEIDDLGRRLDFRQRYLAAFGLGLDQAAQRILIAVMEGFRIEVAGASFDDHGGERDRLVIDLLVVGD